jgi:ankyrin repeat protein
MDEKQRCAEYEQFKKIDAAFKTGDLEALRSAVDDPDDIPNGPMPLTIGPCLEYSTYHSPVFFIRALLEAGANVNPESLNGFPPVIATLVSGRPESMEILALLFSFGADPNQRGINDFTPLHMAVSRRDPAAVELLLKAGADRTLATRIDDCETPLELAQRAGFAEIVKSLM